MQYVWKSVGRERHGPYSKGSLKRKIFVIQVAKLSSFQHMTLIQHQNWARKQGIVVVSQSYDLTNIALRETELTETVQQGDISCKALQSSALDFDTAPKLGKEAWYLVVTQNYLANVGKHRHICCWLANARFINIWLVSKRSNIIL